MRATSSLNISKLKLAVTNASGHEHRMRPIAAAAARMFAARAGERWPAASASIDSLAAAPISLDLAATTNHEAATRIAGAWFDALAARLERR